eukprot:gnl/TRDRNA2_/TRDRNA2_171269_c0_seq2.p1 gnl/TRDRNA2_/TRDRNA2_171269_c0~~gnl/TRDRNA2_/TRDRNA2_171269_c0_seq2.p1  ORF type:complete len:195 (-),score=9.74 gnl/TRDRNA2_/TRDRNA2_171269_c0_seq2:275-859(-)
MPLSLEVAKHRANKNYVHVTHQPNRLLGNHGCSCPLISEHTAIHRASDPAPQPVEQQQHKRKEVAQAGRISRSRHNGQRLVHHILPSSHALHPVLPDFACTGHLLESLNLECSALPVRGARLRHATFFSIKEGFAVVTAIGSAVVSSTGFAVVIFVAFAVVMGSKVGGASVTCFTALCALCVRKARNRSKSCFN